MSYTVFALNTRMSRKISWNRKC